jgi:hypothetical protein
MNTQSYTDNITSYLHTYSAIVKTKNALNLTDATVHAENLFCDLLNTAFNWNLRNANFITQNQDSFDLEDTSLGLYIQVTSNKKHSTKKRASISSFQKMRKKGLTTHFKILYISEKVSASILAKESFSGFSYEGWDIPKLIKDILQTNTTAPKLEPINNILQNELAGKLIVAPNSTSTNSILRKVKLPAKSKDQIHIPRNKLINELFIFTQTGNGLLVGGPGEGKSYLTQELLRKYLLKKIPCYIIRIDTLLVGNDDEIAYELGIATDWLTALSKMPKLISGVRPLLIFDAFDAAKDQSLKSAVLRQIRKAVETLEDSWYILVSARSYDASKSTRLLELFPRLDGRQPISCRNFQVPLLEIHEIRIALKKKNADAIFAKLTNPLQQLLAIPYFLKLFENLLSHTNKKGQKELETVETEEQLLQIFWREKVLTNTANTTFIQRLTGLLSSKIMLACKRTDIAEESHSPIIDDLISSGILGESVSGLTLSFAHNILLDYAISIYIISEEPADLIDYLNKNEMHWFLFRSAYIYFFGRLWRLTRELYWKHFLKVREIDTAAFRLFRQTILNYVIGANYRSMADINSALLNTPSEEKAKIVWKILEALRFLNKQNVPGKEYKLLSDISLQLDATFLWEVGYLTDRAIDQATENHKTRLLKLMSIASLNYLRFSLVRRKTTINKAHIDRNAINWGVRNICRNYEYIKKPGKKEILSMLEILKEPDFFVPIFNLLADKITNIALSDINLSKVIFKTLYNHIESSDSPTTFSSDVTLTLTSNRGQDFQSIHYALERLFPSLLEKYPKEFLPLGIEIVNSDFCRVYPYAMGPKTTTIFIGKQKGKISPDYLKYVNAYDKQNDVPSFITHILIYLQALADKKNTTLLQSAIATLMKKSQAASLWKEIIQFMIKNIKAFKKEAFMILSEKQLLFFSETNTDANILLKTAYPTLSKTKQQYLLKTITSVKAGDYPRRDSDIIERMKSSLLNSISPNTTPGLEKPRQQPEFSPMRRPDTELTIEVKSLLPAEILSDISSLKQFNDIYEGNRQAYPTQAEYSQHLPKANNLLKFRIETTIGTNLLFDCDYEATRYAKLISQKSTELTADAKLYTEKISLFFLDVSAYQVPIYQTGRLNSGIHTFAPNPRINSVESLLHLVNSDTSGNIRRRLLNLFSDNDESVRFIVLHALLEYWHKDKEDFWTIVSERIPIENNPVCLQILVQGISYIDIISANTEKVEQLVISASRIFHKSEDRLAELFQAYSILLLLLYNSFNSKIAGDLLHSGVKYKSFLSSLIFILANFIDPHDETNKYEADPQINQNCFKLLSDILNIQFDAIHGKAISSLTSDDIQSIDTVFTQLFYTVVLGRKESDGVTVNLQRKTALYLRLKPIFLLMITKSGGVGSGFIVGHTGYHFLKLLDYFFTLDPEYILGLIADTVSFSAKNNLTYSQGSLQIIIKITELTLADYSDILIVKKNFTNLITILDLFADSGWFEAVELTVRLKEIF